MQQTVKVYTTDNCPYCMRAKALLKQRGIDFVETKLSWDDDTAWNDLAKISGMQTMPQIFKGQTLIGGYTELAELDTKDQLVSLKT